MLADINCRQTHAKDTCKRDSCWLCAPDCQSPPLKGSTLLYQTALHYQLSIICQLAEPALVPLSRALKEMLNKTGPNIVLWGTLVTGWANLWRPAVQPVFKPHHCYFFRPNFFSRTVVQSVLQLSSKDFHCSALIQEGYYIGQLLFPQHPWWLIQISNFSLEMVSRRIFSITFPGNKAKLTLFRSSLWFIWSDIFFPPALKNLSWFSWPFRVNLKWTHNLHVEYINRNSRQ